jgi:hypothetical protein
LAVCFAALVAAISLLPGTSSAAPLPSGNSSRVTFDGQTIDLRQGWAGARSCLIWRQHQVAECFGTEAQLQAREDQLRGSYLRPATTCSSSLDLYSGRSYSGLHLALWDRGYWQELSYDGFNKLTVSFLGGACGFHLAQGNWGQGWWYPGYTGPWAFATDMGSWDYTISSVYIE